MTRIIGVGLARAAIAASAIVTAFGSTAAAQAWLPPQGEGAVSVMFQDMFVKYHAAPTVRVDAGPIRSKVLIADFTYGVTDKLAISFGIPWVAAKYSGRNPHPVSLTDSTPNPLDDGRYHSTFQDFRFDVRYNVARRGAVVTPFVAAIVPSHEYRYFAHAAPGRRVTELQLGVSAARLLDAVVPGLFVQGRYAYGVAEKVQSISHNRSAADLEIGYFVTPKLRLLALSAGQLTHGGVDINAGVARAQLGPLFAYHDQIDRLNSLSVGAGASYTLTDTIDFFGSVMRTVAQRNGHMLDRGVSVGISWGFTTRRARDKALDLAERGLIKCLCEKGSP